MTVSNSYRSTNSNEKRNNKPAPKLDESDIAEFPSATPYQVFLSCIDGLTDALEERELPDRRLEDQNIPSDNNRRKTIRRASDHQIQA